MKPPATHSNGEEFVTVLEVNNDRNRAMDCSAFVTVVALESSSAEVPPVEEDVVMYRLPGERLGMGLKFEGGMQALECVSHVFIQSVAPDSPAARTATSWGGLAEADEILKIDARAVNRMTRVDCVTTLKKAPVAIKLQVRHVVPCLEPKAGCRNGAATKGFQNGKSAANRGEAAMCGGAPAVPLHPKPGRFLEASRDKKVPEVPVTPPPVPPRKTKVTRKESVSSTDSSTASPPTARGASVAAEEPETPSFKTGSILGMKLPGWEELMQRRSSGQEDLVLPVAPDLYVDLIAEEDRRSLLNEYESDDTGSSVSTVVDRMSSTVVGVQSSRCNGHESPPPLTARSATLDLAQVLGPFEQLEKEIEVDFAATLVASNCVKNCFCEESKRVPLPIGQADEEEIEPPEHFKDCDGLDGPEVIPAMAAAGLTPGGPELTSGHLPLEVNNRLEGCVPSGTALAEPERVLLALEREVTPKRKISPPPVPPRKLKNVKRTNSNGFPAFSEDDFDDPIIALTFPIIGNLLQELEQFPEFHRSSPTISQTSGSVVAAPRKSLLQSRDAPERCPSIEPGTDKPVSLASTDEIRHQIATSVLPSSEEQRYVEPDLNVDRSESFTTQNSAELKRHLETSSTNGPSNLAAVNDAEATQWSSGQHPVAEERKEENYSASSSCEVVAVVEKTSTQAQHVNVQQQQCQDKSDMATDVNSSTSLLDCADDNFMSTFSRLPPDGHEFPPNYLELDCPANLIDTSESSYPPLDRQDSTVDDLLFSEPQKPWHLQPPMGFEDFETHLMVKGGCAKEDLGPPPINVATMPTLNRSSAISCDDVSTVSSKSSDTGDTVIFDELPPPSSVMELISESSSNDGDVFSCDESYERDEIPKKDPYPAFEANRKVFMTEPQETPKRIPPIPPKRNLPPKPLAAERTVKTEDKTLSVKDKIAMFSTASKSEAALPAAQPALPKPRTLKPAPPKQADVPKEATEEVASEDVPPLIAVDSGAVPEEESAPIAADPRPPNELLPIGSYASNGNDYYHDRSGSSLSMSSCFSKSSDDLLSQDMDSSDFDDHPPHHVSVHADRKNAYHQNKRPLSSNLRNGSGGDNGKNSKQYWSTSSTDSDAATESQVRSSLRNKSMYALLESRKQNVSKLKGLVIPQVLETSQKAPTELPLIFSVDSVLLPKVELTKGESMAECDGGVAACNSQAYGRLMPETPLLTNSTLDSQNYSPAFKRKPFTLTNAVSDCENVTSDPVDSSGSRKSNGAAKKLNSLSDRLSHLVPMVEDEKGDAEVPSLRKKSDWFEAVPPPLPKSLPPNPMLKSLLTENDDLRDDLAATSDLDALADTEDRESGISSIESPNASIHNTPPGSPKEVHHSKQEVDEGPFQSRRKASVPKSTEWESNSTATDSDQSSNDPRILKANSVEAINRKNVLQSSRHSSGEFKDVIDGMDFTIPIMSDSPSRKASLSKRSSAEIKEPNVLQSSRNGSGEFRNAIEGMEFTASVPMDSPSRKTSLSKRNSTDYKELNVLQSSKHSSDDFRNSADAVDISYPILTEVVGSNRKVSLLHVTSVCPLEPKELNFNKRQVSLEEKVVVPESAVVATVKTEAKPSAYASTRCKSATDINQANDNLRTEKSKKVSDERWLELERKYGQKNAENGSKLPFEKASPDCPQWERAPEKLTPTRESPLTSAITRRLSEGQFGKPAFSDRNAAKAGGNNFKALAECWEQRATEPSASPPGSVTNMKTSSMLSKSLTSIVQNGSSSSTKPPTAKMGILERSATLERSPLNSSEKVPLPITAYTTSNNGVKMREKTNSPLSRPTSLIESDTKKSKLWEAAFENGAKMGAIERSREPLMCHASKQQRPGGQVQDVVNGKNRRSTSFNDLRQIFENQEMSVPARKSAGEYRLGPKDICNHIRMSSLDSTCTGSDSEEGNINSAHYGSATSLGSNPVDHYGSITSLASSTSLISPQELQQLIDEANQSLEESGTPSHEITVIVLQREIPGGSIGITLAGGADYDSKEITVNKVISGSLADRDGRIQKGDRVLSINGKNLKGVSHREALIILKAPRTDCVLVLSRGRSSSPNDGKENANVHSRISSSNFRNRGIKPSPASVLGSIPSVNSEPLVPITNGSSSILTVQLVKDASGLGFSLDGGKDSPLGDRPLTIKKIFVGGAANKNGILQVGDEILSFNGMDVTKMARIEAWNYMRKLPDGNVTVMVNHKK